MNERIEELAKDCFEYIEGTINGNVIEFDYKMFAELIVRECAEKLVQANMSNPAYAQAMDEYYENKWAHRFD